jgi:hypothetical protein
MNKWITLHYTGGWRLYNSDKFYVIQPNSEGGSDIYESTIAYMEGNEYFKVKESPDEILAILKEPDSVVTDRPWCKHNKECYFEYNLGKPWQEPDTKLRQAARELITGIGWYFDTQISRDELEALSDKLETILEKS